MQVEQGKTGRMIGMLKQIKEDEEEFDIVQEPLEHLDEIFTSEFITTHVLDDNLKAAIQKKVTATMNEMTSSIEKMVLIQAYSAFRAKAGEDVDFDEFEEALEESDSYMELMSSYVGYEALQSVNDSWWIPFLE